MAAETAVRRVNGVFGIAEEIEVDLPVSDQRSDEDIASSLINILRWRAGIPADSIQVEVEQGDVVLTGLVEWQYQKELVEQDARNIRGVRGLNNLITVQPAVEVADVKSRIEEALKRNAELQAANIWVAVEGSAVTLSGHVNRWYERAEAKRAAWSAPGVTRVTDNIRVSP
jgi:osmotically-inducible protein OsmY